MEAQYKPPMPGLSGSVRITENLKSYLHHLFRKHIALHVIDYTIYIRVLCTRGGYLRSPLASYLTVIL